MTPEKIFEKCMRGSLKQLVKGGLIYLYFRSPFFVWCASHAPRKEKDPESAFINMIFEVGRDHEDEVCKDYPGGISIDPTLHERAFMETLKGFFKGEKYVKNGIIYHLPERLVAVPDILVKVPGKSVFGDHYYEVIEIKSSKQIKEEHIMQAAYYTYIMGIIQEKTAEKFYMIDGQKEKSEHLYKDYEEKVLQTIREIKDIFKGKKPRAEKIGWPWESFSIKTLKEEKSISLIPGLFSSHKSLLLESGVERLDDFFNLNILNVTGINPETLKKYRKSAKALINGKHEFLEKPFLPEDRVEIFMDFEGVDSAKVKGKRVKGDYLIGALVRENGKEEYVYFVSNDLENEQDMLFDFLKFLKDKQNFLIYHFGSYEKSHLAGMMHKHRIDDGFAEQVLTSMVDVFQLAKKSVVFPTHSYTLKEIGKYLGFEWSDLANAKDSIVLYMDFLENKNQESMDRIIQYNKDDCIALKKVKDFLVWGT